MISIPCFVCGKPPMGYNGAGYFCQEHKDLFVCDWSRKPAESVAKWYAAKKEWAKDPSQPFNINPVRYILDL